MRALLLLTSCLAASAFADRCGFRYLRGERDVVTAGKCVCAYSFAKDAHSVKGVNFVPAASPAAPGKEVELPQLRSFTSTAYVPDGTAPSLSDSFRAVLAAGAYIDDGATTNLTVRFKGLVSGRHYLAQLFINDLRVNFGEYAGVDFEGAKERMAYAAKVAPHFGPVATYLFRAEGAIKELHLGFAGSIPPRPCISPQMNALQLREVENPDGIVLPDTVISEGERSRLRDIERCFNPAAAERAIADLAKHPGYDAVKHRAAVKALAEKRKAVVDALESDDPVRLRAAAKLLEDFRAAMLANPLLDFDKLLCVRRRVSVAHEQSWQEVDCSGNLHGICRAFGFMGLNAHNHIDMSRKGMDNEIACIENLRSATPAVKTVYRPGNGAIVRDVDLDFDASRILFTSWRGTNDLLGVFEMSLAEKGATPRLVSPPETDVQWWDACYLPNRDQLVLLGTAAYQFLPCEDGNMPMSVLYRLDRKTGDLIQLTFEQDSDYTPVVAHDGKVMFTRWEYSDLQHYFSRELMTMNPDGTGQLALWGSGSYFPTFFYGARSIPGDDHKLVMFGGGHHGRSEMGRMLMVDPTLARSYPFEYDPPDRSWGPAKHRLRVPTVVQPAAKSGMVHEFPGYGKLVEGDVCDLQIENQLARGKPRFSYPWPLSDKYFIASAQVCKDGLVGIYLVDVFDNITLIAEVPGNVLLEPMPLAARKRPPVQPDRRVKGATTCTVHIADIYKGTGLAGVPRGTVKKMRIFAYHFNYQFTGGHVSVGLDHAESGWDVKRVLGTVDVEEDGSVCFEMPACTPVSFQPLDAEGSAVQIMRSWTVGMPGERVSCTGCHEDNRTSVVTSRQVADKKPMQKIVPDDAHGIRPWGFANEMWPQVQRYCMDCHGDPGKAPLRKADQGGAENRGLRLVMNTAEAAYRMLHPYVRRPGAESENPVLNAMEFHTSTSPLVQMLEKGHHGVKVDGAFTRTLYTWIDLNAPWRGKWNPGKDQKWQIPRRLELAKRWGGMTADPEAEYDRHAAIVATQRVERVPPMAVPPPAASPINCPGWPMDALHAAAAQMGWIDQVAPVTTRTIPIGGDASPMTFRRIPAGKFVMGSTSGYPDESPCAVVEIAKPFWISETEVRNDQFRVFDPAHCSRCQDQYGFDQIVPGHVGTHRRQPAVRMTWHHAREFCKWFSEKAGVKADLPTEAQWEWAARAGTATPFPWGGLDDDFGRWANFADREARNMYSSWNGPSTVQIRYSYPVALNYPLHDERFVDDWFTVNYVARALPNAWGLYDMHGNAAEWTRSKYAPYPYVPMDGREFVDGGERRVVRGGSFASRPRDATSSFRQGYLPWQKIFDVGFRVVIED